MSPSFYPLRIFTIIFFFFFTTITPLSTANNGYATVCSNTPYSCGNITNAWYPFWGGDRPQFCGGHPNFRLTCKNGTTFLYDMGLLNNTDGTTNALSSRVDTIDTSSHTMTLVQKNFDKANTSCPYPNKNQTGITLLKPFKFSPIVTNLTVFFDCNSAIVQNYNGVKNSTCFNDLNGNFSAIYYSDKLADIGMISKSCQTTRVFPVLKSELEELNREKVSLLGVFQKGFEVEYMVDFNGCRTCQSSGGSCGSSNDSLSGFVCYCPDGGHPRVCPNAHKKKLGKYLGLGIGGGVLVFVAFLAIWYCKCVKSSKTQMRYLDRTKSELGKESLYLGVPLYSYEELEEATDSFNQTRELGGGGYGTVYYGKLKDGREVAVKRLYERSFRRVEQFMNEVQLLTCLRHQSLVSLYGCTSHHSRELLLVYEYVSNGTVADHLYGHKGKSDPLSWPVRLKIAIETAAALSYLHASDIIHRDVKTNNILLDKDFNVKVADFGLSRLFPNDVTHVSTAPQGTPGYLDPEYHQCYQLTDKSDVYSFGVVLIELISSLRAVDMDRHNYEINLSTFAMNRIQKCAFSELVDPQLGFESDFKVRRMTTSVAELAFQCLQHYKDFRPSMDEVLEVLKRIQSFDYESLQTVKNVVQISNVSPSPTQDDGVKLLSNCQHWRHSPMSVMDIVSSSTMSESTTS